MRISRTILNASSSKLLLLEDMNKAVLYLRKANPHTPEVYEQLTGLTWMLRDKVKYAKLVEILRDMQCYHKGIWTYSLAHEDEQGIEELLAHEVSLQKQLGVYFSSSLISTGALDFMHFDYSRW